MSWVACVSVTNYEKIFQVRSKHWREGERETQKESHLSSFIIPTEKTKVNACRENFVFQQETLNYDELEVKGKQSLQKWF